MVKSTAGWIKTPMGWQRVVRNGTLVLERQYVEPFKLFACLKLSPPAKDPNYGEKTVNLGIYNSSDPDLAKLQVLKQYRKLYDMESHVRPERARWVKTDTGWTKGVDAGTLILELTYGDTELEGYWRPHYRFDKKHGEMSRSIYLGFIGSADDLKAAKRKTMKIWRNVFDNEWDRAKPSIFPNLVKRDSQKKSLTYAPAASSEMCGEW